MLRGGTGAVYAEMPIMRAGISGFGVLPTIQAGEGRFVRSSESKLRKPCGSRVHMSEL